MTTSGSQGVVLSLCKAKVEYCSQNTNFLGIGKL